MGRLPAQAISSSPANVVAGCRVMFSDTAIGTHYTWNFGPNASPPVDSGNFLQADNTYFKKAGSALVTVTVTKPCCGTVTDSLWITVLADTLPISLTFAPDSVCTGAQLKSIAHPAGYQMYSFSIDTNPANYQSSDTFITTSAVPGDSIRVLAYNGLCYTNPVFVLPVVLPLPNPPTLTSSLTDDTLCGGDTITFTATGGYSNYVFQNSSSIQQISLSNTWVTDLIGTGASISVTATMYGCQSLRSNSIMPYVKPRPGMLLSLSPAVACRDTAVLATTVSNGTLFNFYVNGSLMQSGIQSSYSSAMLHNNDIVWVSAQLNGCTSVADSATFKVENCTGIEEADMSLLQLSPNPVSDVLMVTYPVAGTSHAKPAVFNVTGQALELRCIAAGDKFILNTSTLNPGLYFVRLTENGSTFTQKFVKE